MTVGWYVHHHGSGHLHRFLAARDRLPGVVALSSLPRPRGIPAEEWIELPLDAPASAWADPTAGGALHWAPLGHSGLRERMARIAEWVSVRRPAVFVVDVSVEVAAFVRLLGVPVVWVAQRGRRLDDPHRLVYRTATVIAPWTASLASPGCGLPPDAVHVGALSRFDGRAPGPPPDRRRVTLMIGRGGHEIAIADVRTAVAATPDWTWTVAGLDGPGVEDPWRLLCESDVVVGSAGGCLTAEVAAARRPFVCLPQPRPFDEQRDGADVLARAGLAESLAAWPAPHRWSGILERALARDPDAWSALHDGHAAARLAEAVRAAAARPSPELVA